MPHPTAESLMPLDVAVARHFPLGGATKATLLAAIRRGDLACERIGRAYFVTDADVKQWRRKCRESASRPGSSSGAALAGQIDGSLSMDERKSTLAAAQAIVQALKPGLANTSRRPAGSTQRSGIRLVSPSRT